MVSNTDGQHILVTGGCGFVGVNLVQRLVAEGFSVRVLDSLVAGNSEDIAETGARLIEADIRDPDTARSSMHGVQSVVHLAAHTRVMDSIESPELNFDVNARGTLVLLEAARHANVERFVMASTGGAIIGDVEPPVHEEMVPRPISPYGASKLAAEAYLSAYAGTYGMTTVAMRFANVYGPYSYRKGSVIPKFFKQIMDNETLTIYGDGTQTRDFVYVGDIVSGITRSLTQELRGFEQFHLGSGAETSVLKLLNEIARTTGGSPQVAHEPARAGEIYRNSARIQKAQRLLGYAPVTDLSSGLKRTWEWFQGAGSA